MSSRQARLGRRLRLVASGPEEKLASRLGLREDMHMRFVRIITLWLAPYAGQVPSPEFIKAFSRYQRLGQTLVDRQPDTDNARAKAQIALILLSAGVSAYAASRREDLDDAAEYAWNLQLDPGIIDDINRL
jgi:hypothetical protein